MIEMSQELSLGLPSTCWEDSGTVAMPRCQNASQKLESHTFKLRGVSSKPKILCASKALLWYPWRFHKLAFLFMHHPGSCTVGDSETQGPPLCRLGRMRPNSEPKEQVFRVKARTNHVPGLQNKYLFCTSKEK